MEERMTEPEATVVTPVPLDSANRANAPILIGQESEAIEPEPDRLLYRLLTGPDDRAFCARVSAALAEGYRLYGAPAATFNGQRVIVAQAVVLDNRVDTEGALR
jgi:hypothetical protein